MLRAEQADAILALINSKPRTPTRGEIMGALATAGGAQDPQAGAGTLPQVRISERGRALMALFPAFAEAQCRDVHDQPDTFGPLLEETGINEAIETILNPEPKSARLGDLAVAARHGLLEGCQPNESVMAAIEAILSVLLKAAGVPEEQCDQSWHYKQAEQRIIGPLE